MNHNENSPQYKVLTLPVGQIRGVLRKTIYDDTYYSFEGIPYGLPPTGDLRFKSPRPAQPWKGVKDCLDSPPIPVQKNLLTTEIVGTEDCLNLNVYVKRLNSDKPLPVLVWIYGGAFCTGEATRRLYSPDYLMTQDVIVVTVNYRVCTLGFLSLSDPELQIPGNAALKDQILALKWIRQYISYFNGDPNNVTLSGFSSGSVCVHYLMAIRQAEGLFHKAICVGGSIHNPWACVPPQDNAYRLAKKHGYKGLNNDRQVVDFLKSLDVKKLVRHNSQIHADNGFSFSFGPCVEPYDGDDCVVPIDPQEMLRTAWGNEIPLIMGGTADEGLIMRLVVTDSPLKGHPKMLLPLEVRQRKDEATLCRMAQKVLKAHVGNEKIIGRFCQKTIDYYSISHIWHGIHRSLLSRLAYARAPTYQYHFAFDSTTFAHLRQRYCGADLTNGLAHCDDISYLWYGDSYAWKLSPTTREYKMIQNIVGIWTSFMKNSNPGISIWQPLQGDQPNLCLNIADILEMKISPKSELLVVWDSLYDDNKLF